MSGGAFVSVHVDLGDVERGLDAMQSRARALAPAWTEVKQAMKLDQRDHREKQEGPDGKWAPRAASTLARAKLERRHVRASNKARKQGLVASGRKHVRRLARTILGKIPTAVSYTANSSGSFGTSRIGWSQAHAEGSRVGHGAKLPARPSLWISDTLIDDSESIIEAHLLRAFGDGT